MTKMHTLNVKKYRYIKYDYNIIYIWSNRHYLFDGKLKLFKKWIKSNILYVKDLFADNGSLDEIGDEVYDKASLLFEYMIISSAYKNIRNIVDGMI